MSTKIKISLAVVIVTLTAGAVLYACVGRDPQQWVDFAVNRDTHWALFIGLMASLPIFGFPISVFLFLTAIKFGFGLGVLLTFLIIPIHLAASWGLGRTLLYPYIQDYLKSRGYQLLHIPSRRTLLFVSLFVIVPGPPYFLKNYILALSGIHFRYYFVISWSMETAICIPVLGLGESVADMNLWAAGLMAGLIAAGYFMGLRLKKRFFHTES